MRKWGIIMNPSTPPESSKSILAELLAGYVGITDTWGAAMTPELLEMYPDALVICSTRAPDAWWKSWYEVTKNAPRDWVMQILFLPVPVFRYFPFTARKCWQR